MAKISVSVEASDLRWLKSRARRLHGGNLSAAIGEGVRNLRHHEALAALLDDLGAPTPSPREVESLADELVGRRTRRRRRHAAA